MDNNSRWLWVELKSQAGRQGAHQWPCDAGVAQRTLGALHFGISREGWRRCRARRDNRASKTGVVGQRPGRELSLRYTAIIL